jgi:protein-disulfide isomerase
MAINDSTANVIAAATAICALAVTVVVVRREFFVQDTTESLPPPPSPVKNWDRVVASGHRTRADSPFVFIVEFADFECPICGQFARGALKGVLANYGNRVVHVFRHWPLAYHRFAYPAARAAECAGEQGRFAEMHDLLYQKQDSLGLKSFEGFAAEAGVSDPSRFQACYTRTALVPAIEADQKAALEVGGVGTPTVVINGIRYGGAPDSLGLDRIVRRELKLHASP